MKVGKSWMSTLVFLLAMALSTPALAGWGDIELFYKARPGCIVEPMDPIDYRWGYQCASLTIEKAPQNGFVIVTATGNAIFDHPSTILNLTLLDQKGYRVRAFSVTPGEGLKQSWSVRWIYPVKNKAPYAFFLYGQYENNSDNPPEHQRICLRYILMTAEFFKSNKVQRSR